MKLPVLPGLPKNRTLTVAGIVFLLVYSLQNFIPGIDKLPRIAAVLTVLLMFALCIIFFKDELLRDIPCFFRHFGVYCRFVFPRLGIFFLIYMALGMVLSAIVKTGAANQNALADFPFWALVIGAVVYAPLLEEITYRGFLRRIVKNNALFIVASGLIFGAIHMLQPDQEPLQYLYILQYAAFGGFLAWLYAKSDNICCSILAHFTINGIATLILALTR